MEVVVFFETLIHFAKKLGIARQSGNEKEIANAKQEHDAYRDCCLKADRMIIKRKRTL